MKKTIEDIRAIIEKEGFYLLDGALGTELEKKMGKLDPVLWVSGLLRDRVDLIRSLHSDYIKAGADGITTCTYQLSYEGGQQAGLTSKEVDHLFRQAVELAEEAINDYRLSTKFDDRRKHVFASLGPYGAYLANGAEYTGQYAASDEILKAFHKKRLATLSACSPDIFLFETIPSFRECTIICDLLSLFSEHTFVIAFQCRDEENLADGTPIKQVVPMCTHLDNLFAVGANCINPNLGTGILNSFRSAGWKKDLIIYPNKGGVYHGDTKNWHSDVTCDDPLAHLRGWIHLGAGIIGGCCGLGPSETARMKALKTDSAR